MGGEEKLTRSSDIEAIKRVQGQYCRAADTKDWALLRSTLTDDFYCDTGAVAGRDATTGVEMFIQRVAAIPAVTVHQAFLPEIEFTSPTTAEGVWAAHSFAKFSDGSAVDGYGHYHNIYAKVGDAWRLRSLQLKWLHREIRPAQSERADQAWLGEAVLEMRAKGKAGEKILAFNEALIAEYRASGGKSPGALPPEKVGIITMKGAKSGLDRAVPLGVEEIDGRVFIIATQGGLPTHPNWYYNLAADPLVTVEFRAQTWRARAVQIEGADRDRIFGQLPGNYHHYQARIAGARTIPVFELRRID
jgi:deazaflavin-dependent oxidoreductase (nitroreductase family)